MTDFDRVKSMIESAQHRGQMKDGESKAKMVYDACERTITIYAGYGGFFTILEFDEEFRLSNINAWE